jgi:hypothetical protein
MPPEAADALAKAKTAGAQKQPHPRRQSTLGAHMIPEIGHFA